MGSGRRLGACLALAVLFASTVVATDPYGFEQKMHRNVKMYVRVEGFDGPGEKRSGTGSQFYVSAWATVEPPYGTNDPWTHARVTGLALTIGGETVDLQTAVLQEERLAEFGRQVRWMTNKFETALPDGSPTTISLKAEYTLERYGVPIPEPLSGLLEQHVEKQTVEVVPNVYNVALRLATQVGYDLQGNVVHYQGAPPPSSYPYVANAAAVATAGHYATMKHAVTEGHLLAKNDIVHVDGDVGAEFLKAATTFMGFTHGEPTKVWDTETEDILISDVAHVAVGAGRPAGVPGPSMAWHYSCNTGQMKPYWAVAYGFAAHVGGVTFDYFANRAFFYFTNRVWSMLAPGDTSWTLNIPDSQIPTVLTAGLNEHTSRLFARLAKGWTAGEALANANTAFPPRRLARIVSGGTEPVGVFQLLRMEIAYQLGSSEDVRDQVRFATLNRVYRGPGENPLSSSDWWLVFEYDPITGGNQVP